MAISVSFPRADAQYTCAPYTIVLQIAIQEARIADWGRHRDWLEREIAALEAETVSPASARSEKAG